MTKKNKAKVKVDERYSFRYKSDLKRLLDNENVTIAKISNDLGLRTESVRTLYHDEMKRYPADMLGKICTYLNVSIDELLLLQRIDKDGNDV